MPALVKRPLPRGEDPLPPLPAWAWEAMDELSRTPVEELSQLAGDGVRVVGDLDDLRLPPGRRHGRAPAGGRAAGHRGASPSRAWCPAPCADAAQPNDGDATAGRTVAKRTLTGRTRAALGASAEAVSAVPGTARTVGPAVDGSRPSRTADRRSPNATFAAPAASWGHDNTTEEHTHHERSNPPPPGHPGRRTGACRRDGDRADRGGGRRRAHRPAQRAGGPGQRHRRPAGAGLQEPHQRHRPGRVVRRLVRRLLHRRGPGAVGRQRDRRRLPPLAPRRRHRPGERHRQEGRQRRQLRADHLRQRPVRRLHDLRHQPGQGHRRRGARRGRPRHAGAPGPSSSRGARAASPARGTASSR